VSSDIDPENWYQAVILNRSPSFWGMVGLVGTDGFPAGMDTSRLYPEVSSLYTLPDGSQTEVMCSRRPEWGDQDVECPGDFLPSISPGSVQACVRYCARCQKEGGAFSTFNTFFWGTNLFNRPCPVQAFSESQYYLMWLCLVVPGILGLALNVFMMATFGIGGKQIRKVGYYQKYVINWPSSDKIVF
jgi:hypothetical protein